MDTMNTKEHLKELPLASLVSFVASQRGSYLAARGCASFLKYSSMAGRNAAGTSSDPDSDN